MEPGLVAAGYAAETAIEGVAAAAFAITRPTAPLKARYWRVLSPSSSLTRYSHTLNVIKDRAYIFGGDGEGLEGNEGDNNMHVVTLPTDITLMDTDFQQIPAVPKARKGTSSSRGTSEAKPDADSESIARAEGVPSARAGHCSAVIGDRIYVFGGSSPTGTNQVKGSRVPPMEEDGNVYAFDTIAKTWEVLKPNSQGGTEDVPTPRNYASCSSITHPLPIRAEGSAGKKRDDLMTTEEAKLRLVSEREGEELAATNEQQSEGYGTFFLHGGYDADGNALHDIWAFEVSSRTWSRWPDLPDSDVDLGEGNICCVEKRLWRYGGEFGKMAHLDIVLNEFNDMSGKGELGVSPGKGEWQVRSFGVEPEFEATEIKVEEKMGGRPANSELLYPIPRKRAGLIPASTGQGRDYLILVMGEQESGDVLDDIWSFQTASEKKTAAALKDNVRSILGRSTGAEEWAKAAVPETTKDEGLLDHPKGLSRFGSSAGGDSNFPIVIWGGIGSDGRVSGDGWILMLE